MKYITIKNVAVCIKQKKILKINVMLNLSEETVNLFYQRKLYSKKISKYKKILINYI